LIDRLIDDAGCWKLEAGSWMLDDDDEEEKEDDDDR